MLINITIPVYNEELALPISVPKVHRFLAGSFRFNFELVIANNASTDRTQEVAGRLAREFPGTRVVHLDLKGRGRALKKVWSESAADIFSYMDVDLSTELGALPPLIEALATGGFDLGIGSRLQKQSQTNRGIKREFISRSYNHIVKLFFDTSFSDAQCGFKAITREAAQRLLPAVEDNGWFLDSELLILAEKSGYRIFDLPVKWTDDPDSRVRIVKTAWEDLKGLWRVRHGFKQGKYEALKKPKVIQPTQPRIAGPAR